MSDRAEIEVTPEMVEAGFRVLKASCITDDLAEGDRLTVAEIYATMHRAAGDPTLVALRRALDGHAAALEDAPSDIADAICGCLPRVIYGCLPRDVRPTAFFATDGTLGPRLAISFKPAFERYVTFAAEYWAGLVHRNAPVEATCGDGRK